MSADNAVDDAVIKALDERFGLAEPKSKQAPISTPDLEGSTTQSNSSDSISASPDLIRAYAANMGKVLFLFAFVIGAYFLALQFTTQDYVFSMVESVGVSISLVKSVLIGIASIILLLVIFDTSSLSSIYLGLSNTKLTYSYGNFFKITKTFPVSSIIRANYHEYWPFSTGILEIELSGTTLKSVKIPFVPKVKDVCESIHSQIKASEGPGSVIGLEGGLDE